MRAGKCRSRVCAQNHFGLGFGEQPEAGLLVEALRPHGAFGGNGCEPLDLAGGDGGDATAEFHRQAGFLGCRAGDLIPCRLGRRSRRSVLQPRGCRTMTSAPNLFDIESDEFDRLMAASAPEPRPDDQVDWGTPIFSIPRLTHHRRYARRLQHTGGTGNGEIRSTDILAQGSSRPPCGRHRAMKASSRSGRSASRTEAHGLGELIRSSRCAACRRGGGKGPQGHEAGQGGMGAVCRRRGQLTEFLTVGGICIKKTPPCRSAVGRGPRWLSNPRSFDWCDSHEVDSARCVTVSGVRSIARSRANLCRTTRCRGNARVGCT